MFPIPTPPDIEPTEGLRQTVARLFPLETMSSRVMPFAAFALKFRGVAFGSLSAKEQMIANWQHGCIETVGGRYSDLLIAHCFLESNPNCAAGDLHDATRKKTALFYEGEKEMQLLRVAILPPDLAKGSRPPTDAEIRYCHTRLLGAIALTIPYRELKSFFHEHYFRHRPSPTAGLSFKTVLLEFSQANGHGIPIYKTVQESGPEHAKSFEVQVTVGRLPNVVASGASKKRAEEAAAEKWLLANARLHLQTKTLEIAHGKRPNRSPFSLDHLPELDGHTMRALRHFGLPDAYGYWLRRALTHPSVRTASHLPEYETNRTTAVFGSYILQAGFSHYLTAHHFSLEQFALHDASIPMLCSKAVSAEALAPLVDRLGIARHVRIGSQTNADRLNYNQRASFLEALTGVRFLAQNPNFDLQLTLGPDLIGHVEEIVSGAKKADDLKSPLSRLQEFAECQHVRMIMEEPIASGPLHQGEFVARIRFTNELSHRTLIIRGGKGASARAARQSLARLILPILAAIHHDFQAARRMSSADLVGKLTDVFLSAAFTAAPKDVIVAQKWRGMGLLGSGLLFAGEFTSFSHWATEAANYLRQSATSLHELESGALVFYQLIGKRRVWDVRSVAQRVVASVKDFATSNEALTKVRSLKQEAFFLQMQDLLRVLSLAAKPKDHQTTLRHTFDGLALLRRRDYQLRYTFDGPDLVVEERDGATIELCSEILDALVVSSSQPQVQVEVHVDLQSDMNTVIIRHISPGPCHAKERLDNSLVVSFLQAERLIDTIRAEGNEVTCVFPQSGVHSFASKARAAVESPFAGLQEESRSALRNILHDLKNQLIGAEIAVVGSTMNRTLALRAQAQASEHLDAACRLAEQFALLSGVLEQPIIAAILVPEFFRRYCTRLFTGLPQSVSLGMPASTENASVWTSERFLESIMDNLVRNSVEAMNGRGSLDLSWEVLQDTSSLVITIRDTGPGIPPDLLNRLLAGQSVSSTKPSGTGVGMLTVVSMVRLLGGKISGTSFPECGTNWTLCIPSLAPKKLDGDTVPTESANLSTESLNYESSSNPLG
jgi:dsRNA-specific ribonuclease